MALALSQHGLLLMAGRFLGRLVPVVTLCPSLTNLAYIIMAIAGHRLLRCRNVYNQKKLSIKSKSMWSRRGLREDIASTTEYS